MISTTLSRANAWRVPSQKPNVSSTFCLMACPEVRRKLCFSSSCYLGTEINRYIADLESKIRALESERRTPAISPSELDMGIRSQSAGGDSHVEAVHSPSADLQPAALIFNLVPGHQTSSPGALPELPPDTAAKQLVEAAYLYTQARYCIVDWVQVRKWHQQRDSICYASRREDDQTRIGAFFVWIIYAIGARLGSHSEYSYQGYFNRALHYLDAVLQPQDLSSLQALLCLIQYNCRVSGGPSHWSLVGTAMRLCVELGYHRRLSPSSGPQKSPRTIELEKRFFWCAYCFDRMVSIASRRPFSIHDLDLDVNSPVDIDVSSTEEDTIRDLQLQQESGGSGSIPGTITSLSTALHHLQMYRIQSRIYQRFTGPYALPPTYGDVNNFLVELDHWKQNALQKQLSSVPQQSTERVQATYLQTVLLLFRPVLDQSVVGSDLLRDCANFAADACEVCGHSVDSLNNG